LKNVTTLYSKKPITARTKPTKTCAMIILPVAKLSYIV